MLEQFAAHYLPMNVLESVQPGIGGDYGEALFPALGNWPGWYHATHRGRTGAAVMTRRPIFAVICKGAIPSSTRSTEHGAAATAASRKSSPCCRNARRRERRISSVIMWYQDSMTRYSEFWMAECRRVFPGLPVYLCTGGADDEVTSGALFAAQAKVAAKHGGGIRLTNEGVTSSIAIFLLTAPAHAACHFYGSYLGLEPVGPITEAGIRNRIFGSAAFGNRQMFHYYNNVSATRKTSPCPPPRCGAAILRRSTGS